MGSPRVDVGQCDKDNHGWREGPPLTVLFAKASIWRLGLHPPVKSISNEKRILLSVGGREPLIQNIGRYKGRSGTLALSRRKAGKLALDASPKSG